MRTRFMDLFYAVIVGNALQAMNPTNLDVKLWFSLFLLLIILEDFFLYYGDVAPENASITGISFFNMMIEISILIFWYFAFLAFQRDSWLFAVFLGLFSFQKSFAGFLNCLVSRSLVSLKFIRELMFLATVVTAGYAYSNQDDPAPHQAIIQLITIGSIWLCQTALWWLSSLLFRSKTGGTVVLTGT